MTSRRNRILFGRDALLNLRPLDLNGRVGAQPTSMLGRNDIKSFASTKKPMETAEYRRTID
eukprot:CAMPEP_0113617470 /NCGR_PEP_ID=MMETSP0017_2-20120614/8799_1 /TAXON_ID=2856 /ORGANISM="Cylindrotheca closterium" /LENGTH=60 /DNA_ID=CAMNT_0000526871 /DNA_START=573 /DNA_END=755 /DNA_ORIENTATION=- /assembly_acc=CAM_ASM_000147